MSRTRIKVCGVRTVEAALAAAEHGADSIGFIFVKGSVRQVAAEDAFEIQSALPPLVSTVGVFQNPDVDFFCDVEEACPTTIVQLHGEEDEGLVRDCGPGVIKGVTFRPETIAKELRRWNEHADVDAILIDGTRPGSGEAFDWNLLVPHLAEIEKPIILAGGLTPENVGEAIRTVRPYAVDVSSGVERERGVKDEALIEKFCREVRKADAEA
ncbi:MAG: phosphoribosylanthranilate isomerase [Planctomycetota bacterium]|nr:phosphoribosylanthranilate isomerase [Planctomycetota bacterium]